MSSKQMSNRQHLSLESICLLPPLMTFFPTSRARSSKIPLVHRQYRPNAILASQLSCDTMLPHSVQETISVVHSIEAWMVKRSLACKLRSAFLHLAMAVARNLSRSTDAFGHKRSCSSKLGKRGDLAGSESTLSTACNFIIRLLLRASAFFRLPEVVVKVCRFFAPFKQVYMLLTHDLLSGCALHTIRHVTPLTQPRRTVSSCGFQISRGCTS